jgi:WD40 repeat protein
VNQKNGHVALGYNDSTISIRNSYKDLDNVLKTIKPGNESGWIEVLRYSPDGSKLAVGTHDRRILIYAVD